jgi:lipopolysaccharide biosynthesis glycosyltransferase
VSHDEAGKPVSPEGYNEKFGSRLYFNTGVLYVNTSKWMARDCRSLCLEELRLQKESGGQQLAFYTQGAINNALHDMICPIDIKYNTQGLGHRLNLSKAIIENSVILHWNGPKKPWLRNGLYKQ